MHNIPDDPDYIPAPEALESPDTPAREPRAVHDIEPRSKEPAQFDEAFKQISPGELEDLLAIALGRRLGRELSADLIKLEFDYQRGAVITLSVKEPMPVDFSF